MFWVQGLGQNSYFQKKNFVIQNALAGGIRAPLCTFSSLIYSLLGITYTIVYGGILISFGCLTYYTCSSDSLVENAHNISAIFF